jgi:hypothetical protein
VRTVSFKGPYPTDFTGNTSAMVISDTTFSGGVTNAGVIGPGGIAVISSTFQSGGIRDIGVISGGISVDSHSKIVAGGGHTFTAIAVESTVTFAGGISNAGIISAPDAGILVAALSTFSGNISNAGTISAVQVGIKLGTVTASSGVVPLPVKNFIGNVINTGTISAQIGIEVFHGSVNGGIVGNGTIAAGEFGSHTSGTLTVSSGGVSATVTLVGNYSLSNFSSSTVDGIVRITDPGIVGGGSVNAETVKASMPHSGIDLPDIAFGAQTTLAYAEDAAGNGGTLTVTDGRHTAAIALLGDYMAGSFVTAADGHGGTLVADASQMGPPPLLTHPRA